MVRRAAHAVWRCRRFGQFLPQPLQARPGIPRPRGSLTQEKAASPARPNDVCSISQPCRQTSRLCRSDRSRGNDDLGHDAGPAAATAERDRAGRRSAEAGVGEEYLYRDESRRQAGSLLTSRTTARRLPSLVRARCRWPGAWTAARPSACLKPRGGTGRPCPYFGLRSRPAAPRISGPRPGPGEIRGMSSARTPDHQA